MTSSHQSRRSGLGRSVADIVSDTERARQDEAPNPLLSGPTVVPIELLPFPMVIADATGRVLAVNQRWVRLTGLNRSDSLGSGWLTALDSRDRRQMESLVRGVAGGAPIRHTEFELASTGARRTWWLAAHEQAGERLVGIAVGEPVEVPPAVGPGVGPGAAAAPGLVEPDPALAELPGLLYSLRELLETVDRLAQRLTLPEEVAV